MMKVTNPSPPPPTLCLEGKFENYYSANTLSSTSPDQIKRAGYEEIPLFIEYLRGPLYEIFQNKIGKPLVSFCNFRCFGQPNL